MHKNAQNISHSNTETHTEIPNSHTLFGSLMKETLIPLNLEVESSYEVGKGPPKLDVLIIRRKGKRWTDEQLEFLPDQKNTIIYGLNYFQAKKSIS